MSPPELARRADVWGEPRFEQGAFMGGSLAFVQPLFDQLNDVPFYVKNQRLEYVTANLAMARLCGARDGAALVGRTAYQLLPEAAAALCEQLERRAIESQRTVRHHLLELARAGGSPSWILATFIPLFDRDVCAVAGLGRVLDANERRRAGLERVARAVASIGAQLGARIRVSELAEQAGVSVSQLERDFMEVFDMSPNRYIAVTRLEAAMDMLRGCDTIADIAHACGYADQSAFTRRFQAALAVTPSEFRRRTIRERNARA